MSKYSLLLLIIIMFGCAENELRQSIFIPDPADPSLPAYSEWGYNTFGAYYDREIIISTNFAVPVKAISESNVFSFEFYGEHRKSLQDGNPITIRFTLPDFHPASYIDLANLHATTFDLTSAAKVSIDNNQNVQVLSGQLQFKRVQSLLVDRKPEQVILSGYFDFKIVIDDTPVSVSGGRFDVGIGPNDFYNY